MARRFGGRIVEAYYLATPLFFLGDLIFDAPVRAAAFQTAAWRYAYYVLLLGLGLLCRFRPRLAPLVGMGESAANLLLLILSIMLPIWGMADLVLADEPVTGAPTVAQLVNFVLAGGMAIISFKQNEGAFYREIGRRQ